jgi:hypothetical protein
MRRHRPLQLPPPALAMAMQSGEARHVAFAVNQVYLFTMPAQGRLRHTQHSRVIGNNRDIRERHQRADATGRPSGRTQTRRTMRPPWMRRRRSMLPPAAMSRCAVCADGLPL